MIAHQEREAALPGADEHPADSIPTRPTAAQRAQQRAAAAAQAELDAAASALSPTPEPEGTAPDMTVDVDNPGVEQHTAQEESTPSPKKKTRSAGRSKAEVAQAPSLSRLEAKQLKKSVSDAAYATAAAARKAQDRLDELVETIERAVADGLPAIVIEAEVLAACAAADVELPLDDLRRVIRP